MRLIQGHWQVGRQGDNLAIFNRLIREGKSEVEAALGTHTGQWAKAANFGKVQVVPMEGPEGNYTKVIALFEPDG